MSGTARPQPLDQLMAWHRDGGLAAHFAAVPALMAELSGDQLVAAGHLLARTDLDGEPRPPAVTIGLTGHGTVTGLVPSLAAELGRHGLALRPVISGFDSYVSFLGDARSELYQHAVALTLFVLDASMVFDEMLAPWTVPDLSAALTRKLDLIEQLVAMFADTANGTLVLNTMPLPYHYAAQLVDHRARAELGVAWREANTRLLRLVARYDAVVVIDLDPLVAEGLAAVDLRLARYAKVSLSPALLARYARQVGHLARQVTGRTRKCLVVDLDETLWGGVLSEDGPDGIELAGSRRGEAFQAFQRVVRQLGSQGVLLAAASKNELQPVLRVLTDHPDMTLREADFVRVAASWEPKYRTLADLAEDLNLGLDAFVFVDDSAHECGVVRTELPQVAVVRLADEPATHIERLLADDWFGVRELTESDRERTTRYRAEARRADFRKSFAAVENYLADLDVRAQLEPVGEREVARVSQLTLRTNQFNLTTRRMQPGEVRAAAAAPGSSVLAISASDRFGDSGIVGAIVLRRVDDRLHVENFLLSCRVFGREIERACLSAVLRHARETGATAVVGHYQPTPKNAKFAAFYPSNGFVPAPGEGSSGVFVHDLAEIPAPPAHVLMAGIPGGVAA